MPNCKIKAAAYIVLLLLSGCDRIYEKVRFKYNCPDDKVECYHIMMAVKCECTDGGK